MIYVLCPGAFKTGGTELLHQLVYQINKLANNQDATIVYYGDNTKNPEIKEFDKYIDGRWIRENEVNEDKNNIFIFPETGLSEFNKFKLGKKYIWWLSVDNFNVSGSYIGFSGFKNIFNQRGFYHTIGGILKGKIKRQKKAIEQADMHLFQSYYAADFLKHLGILESKKAYLSDYINDIYFDDIGQFNDKVRKNVVLYNPKKGYNFTKKLISQSNNEINWVPLINMTNDEVKNTLLSSKVYIDFGNHPGKDRFPREAAILGCCIITDKRGSAGNNKDIPILSKYKFADTNENVSSILNQIKFCLNNYEESMKDFQEYRNRIKREKSEFEVDCKHIFKYKN